MNKIPIEIANNKSLSSLKNKYHHLGPHSWNEVAIFRIAVDLPEIDKHTKTTHSGETVEISVDDVCKEVEPSTETRKLAWAKHPAILNVIYQSGGLKRPPITEGASE